MKMCGPLTPDQALRLYRSQLTPLEQAEIQSYPDVYFVGPNAKKRPAVSGGTNNSGYDDEQGGYIHVAHDHLAYRYEFLKVRCDYCRVCVCVVTHSHIGMISNFPSHFCVICRLLEKAVLVRWLKSTTTSCSSTWL